MTRRPVKVQQLRAPRPSNACLPFHLAAPPTRSPAHMLPRPPAALPTCCPAYLGNGKLIIKGRVVHVQLQVDVLELFAAKTARRTGEM